MTYYIFQELGIWIHFVSFHLFIDVNNIILKNIPDSKVQGANMGPIWVRQDPGGPHVGPMNFAIWDM